MGKLFFALTLTLAMALVACTAAGGGAPGPDGGGKADDINGDCVPLTCQPDWCLKRSDGCGGVLDCGECGPGDNPGDDDDPFDDDPVEEEEEEEEPIVTCQDDGDPDESSPRDLGEYDEDGMGQEEWDNSSETLFPQDPGALLGSDVDHYELIINDTSDWGNPGGGVAIRAEDTSEDLEVVVEVACLSGKEAEITDCGQAALDAQGRCEMTIPANSLLRNVDMRWNCINGSSETALITASIRCEGGSCSGCQPYQVGALIHDGTP